MYLTANFTLWLFIILVVLIVLFIALKRKAVYIPLISGLVFFIAIGVSFFITNQNSYFDPRYIVNYQPDKEIVLNSNQLSYINNEPLDLKNNSNNMFPIYLKTLDDYYLVIYSKDKDKTLVDGLYIQYDYEFYPEDVDRLYIISKASGKFLTPRVYNLIGSTVNLNLAKNSGGNIVFPVYKPYTLDFNYYYSFSVYESLDLVHVTSRMFGFARDREVVKLDFIDDMHVVVFDDGSIEFANNKLIEVSENIISYSGKYFAILDDKIYVKQGYFKFHNNLLYIVGNDMSIYKFQYETLIFVKELDDLANWSAEIDIL